MDKQTNIALRKTLDQIGASHSLKGYTYTIRAIEKCLDDRDALRCVMKEIYAKIAEENGTTASKVERNIRNLIEVTWINGNVNAINEILVIRFRRKGEANQFRIYCGNNRFCVLERAGN